jgi:hypothetical protein
VSDQHPIESVPMLVAKLYEVVAELNSKFGRKFTPDGHLVGSIGEVLAAHRYGLTLMGQSTKGYDALSADGRQVEIKATQGKSAVALRHEPEHLIVLQLDERGGTQEVYNGPGAPAWQACGKMQKNGQRTVSLSTLRKLMLDVPQANRIAPAPHLAA